MLLVGPETFTLLLLLLVIFTIINMVGYRFVVVGDGLSQLYMQLSMTAGLHSALCTTTPSKAILSTGDEI